MTRNPWSHTVFFLAGCCVLCLSRHVSLRDAIALVGTKFDLYPTRTLEHCRRSARLRSAENRSGRRKPLRERERAAWSRKARRDRTGIIAARQAGVTVEGLIPADWAFYHAREGRYDVAMNVVSRSGGHRAHEHRLSACCERIGRGGSLRASVESWARRPTSLARTSRPRPSCG